MGIVKQEQAQDLNKQMKTYYTIKRKLGKLEKMLLLLGGENSLP
jgi:hypothetical protein